MLFFGMEIIYFSNIVRVYFNFCLNRFQLKTLTPQTPNVPSVRASTRRNRYKKETTQLVTVNKHEKKKSICEKNVILEPPLGARPATPLIIPTTIVGLSIRVCMFEYVRLVSGTSS